MSPAATATTSSERGDPAAGHSSEAVPAGTTHSVSAGTQQIAREGPHAFASARPLSREELLKAPVRWPRPSRLEGPLEVPSEGKLADGLEALGLTSVGALLEHLPRDSREARTVTALKTGEPATVAVQVRRINARAVRRRGMKPLVEATVFDATGSMRATFFNQPWLAQRYAPGTRLILHGKTTERGTFNVAHHALGSDATPDSPPGATQAAGEIAHYPASDGVSSTQILALVQSERAALHDMPETLGATTLVSEGLAGLTSTCSALSLLSLAVRLLPLLLV